MSKHSPIQRILAEQDEIDRENRLKYDEEAAKKWEADELLRSCDGVSDGEHYRVE